MRQFFTLCCLTLFPIFTSAQVTIDIGNESIICANSSTTITIDFTVTDFVTITGMQFTLDWDEDILTNAMVTNINPNVNGLSNSNFTSTMGKITLAWGSTTPSTLNDGDLFFSLTFNPVGNYGNSLVTINGSITPIFVAQGIPFMSIPLIVNDGFVEVIDNTPPNITCPANITQDNDAGLCTTVVNWTEPTPTDNCAVSSTVSSHSSGDNFPVGNITVTYTTTDAAGNTATCDFAVTVSDTETPTITCPANVVQNNDAGMCSATVTWPNPSASDNCGLMSMTTTHNTGDAFNIGITTVTYTVTDVNGNTADCDFTVTVNDTEAPNITCPANITQTNPVATWTVPTPTDNCAISSTVSTHNSGDTFSTGTTTVTYTTTDTAGTPATCDFDVTITSTVTVDFTIEDETFMCLNTATIITIDFTVTNFVSITGMQFTMDWEETILTNVMVTNINTGVNGLSGANFTPFPASGEMTLVLPNSPPSTLTDGAVIFSLTFNPTGNFGNSPISINGNIVPVVINQGNPPTNIAHTVNNGSVNINDSTPPNITCPANIMQSNDAGSCMATVIWAAPTPTDNCAVSSTVSSHNSGDDFPVGNTTVTYTATDTAGNTATCDFAITVNDTEAPTITCPANVVQNNDAGMCSAVVAWSDPPAGDNCGLLSMTTTHNTGETFNVGTTTVSYTVTDVNGNTANCNFTVTVNDTEAPTITCPANITQNSSVVTWTEPSPTDNCMISSTVSTHNSGDSFPNGTTTVTYITTDNSGNTATCDFDVTVNGTTTVIFNIETENIICADPASTVTIDVTVENFVNIGGLSFTINWDKNILTNPTENVHPDINGELVTHFPDDGKTTFVWTDINNPVTLTDGTVIFSLTFNPTGILGTSPITIDGSMTPINVVSAGPPPTTAPHFINAGSVTFTDPIAPMITCPANIAQSNDAGMCAAVVTWTAPMTSDNCAVSTTIGSHNSGDSFPVGNTIVNYTVTDVNGNTATCTFTITVNDTEAPSITCPADIIENNDTGMCSAAVTWPPPSASDNCAVMSMSASHSSGDTFNVGTTAVTYTVTDDSGNTNSCNFTVTVNDTETPNIMCPANIAQSSSTVTWTIPSPTDNCAISSTISTHNSGDFFPNGTTTVTYTTTDTAGNTTTCDFDVTITGTSTVIFNIETENIICADTASTLTIDITVDNFVNIGGLSFTISWDENILTNPMENVHPDINGELVTHFPDDGKTTFVWTDINNPVSFANGTILISLTFNPTGALGTSPITIDGSMTPINVVSAGPPPTPNPFLINAGSVTFTDPIAPMITCPANISQNNDAGMCSAIVTWTAPTASDNCAVSSTIGSHNSGDSFLVGTTTVDYTVTDVNGNTATCNFTVTVNDTETPMITCPANISQSNDPGMCGAVINWTQPVPTDNCAVSSTTVSLTSGNMFNPGTSTVTYTTTDIYGNTGACNFTITVQDTEAPTITCPANIIQNNDAGMCAAIVTWTTPVTSDNCAVSSTISTHNSGDFYPVGNTIVIYTVTDVNGNPATCNFTIMVNDAEAPTLTCPANINQNADAGMCSATVNWAIPVATDNCAVSSTVSTHNSGDSFSVGNTIVNYTATDVNGNTATCNFAITINDTKAPTLSCPSNIIQVTDPGMCTTTVSWAIPTATDNCLVSSNIGSHNSGDSFSVGTTTITYTATDVNGNSTSCSFTITINDAESPTLTCPDNIVQMCTPTTSWTIPVAMDNCGVSSTIGSHNPGDSFNTGTTTVTYTATDVNGNLASCSFTITIDDPESPSLTCPDNIIQMCTPTANWTVPVATDNCGVSSTFGSHNPGDSFNTGSTTVTYTATDVNGNSTSCSFTVTIDDTESPSLTCPDNIVQMCTPIANWTIPVATDNCGVSSTIGSHNPGDSFNAGMTTVTYTATDINDNSTSCSFTVTIDDTESPSLTCPDNIVQMCTPTANWTIPVATDNCGVSSTIGSHNPGDSFNAGTTTVTYTATDVNDNSTSCSFTVTIDDNESPTLTCPDDIVQMCSPTVTWTIPVATDNCGISSTIGSHDPGDKFNGGVTTVTYTTTDVNGNSASCSFTVTITDTENPSLTCPTDISESTDPNMCSAMVAWTTPTVTDNCGFSTLTSSHSPNDLFPIGTTSVTYTAEDAVGNSSTCSFNITVSDNENPTVVCPADLTINVMSGMTTAIVTGIDPIVGDNCGTNTTYQLTDATMGSGANGASGNTFNLGMTTVTYTVTDPSGNTTFCSFMVNVSANCFVTEFDNCPDPITRSVDAGTCQAIITWNEPTTACPDYTITSSHNSGDSFPVGITTVTYIGTHTDGSTVTCSFDVEVIDDEAPQVVTCPMGTITVSAMTGTCEANVIWMEPTFSDNCGVVSVVQNHSSNDIFPVGSFSVNYIASDAAGLFTLCSFDVEVQDTEFPVIQNPQADITISNNVGQCGANIAFNIPMATDNCGIQSLSCDAQPGDFFPIGQTTVNCVAMDVNGNVTLHSFEVTVEDAETPTIACPANIEMSVDGTIISDPDNFISSSTPVDCDNIILDFTEPNATDNCGVTSFIQFQGSPSGSQFSVGANAMQYEALDAGMNQALCDFTITIQSIPPASITIDNPNPCEGEDIELQTSGFPSSSFVWKNEAGDVIGMGDVLQFNDVILSNSGIYTLETIISSVCTTILTSPMITVLQNPELEASANDILCTDGSLDLNLNANNLNGTTIDTWSWTGPDNFNNATQDPTIPAASTEKAGTYTVTATASNGCQSSATVEVSISEEPPIPAISVNDDAICTEDQIILTGENYNGNSVTYNWFANPSADVIFDAQTNSSTSVQINAIGDFNFGYTATVDGCVSDVAILTVNVQEAPMVNLESIGDLTCLEGDTDIQLNETLGQAATYTWTTPSGNTTTTQNLTVSGATSADNGDYILNAASSNGCEITETINLTITDAITTVPGLTLNEIEFCEGGNVVLSSTNFGADAIYHWIGQGLPNTTLDTFVTTTLTMAGNYNFQLLVEVDGCLSDTVDAGVVVENDPVVNPFIDGNTLCIDSLTSITLMANSDSGVNFVWRNENGDTLSNTENLALNDITFSDSGNYEVIATSAIGCEGSAILPVNITEALPAISITADGIPCEDATLKMCTEELEGANYAWIDPDGNNFSSANCPTLPFLNTNDNGLYQVITELNGCTETASFELDVLTGPVAEDDEVSVIINTITEFTVLINDQIATDQDVQITIIQEPIHGTVEHLGDGLFRYTPKEDNLEMDAFRYEICYTDCPNSCDIAFVTFNHRFPDGDCTATSVITPNNDGINDNLTFFCLDSGLYPNNELIIFNIWGDKVYETTGYLNDWKGTYDGRDLPDGTYYYVFLRDSTADADKGFVMIYR